MQQLLWRVLTPSGLEVAEEKTEALVAADVWQRAEQVEQVKTQAALAALAELVAVGEATKLAISSVCAFSKK